MRLTNKLGLPQPLYDAVARKEYDNGGADISVTGLLRPPRISILEEKHADEIEEDASDRIFSLLGQVVHGILEKSDTSGVSERRLNISVEGWKVSGQMDRYFDGVLQDYKLTTLWKFKGQEVAPEFAQQLNIYAEILRANGHPVNRLQVVGILRDWSSSAAKRDPELPQQQVIVRDVPLWGEDFTRKFIRDRVILHQQAKITLPECTPEDRWARPETYAVIKPGGKRAVRVYTNAEDAANHIEEDRNLSLLIRPGESVRCENYCSVSKFCQQFQKEKENS